MPDILWTSVSEPVATVSTSKAFLDVCSAHGLSQHVSTYTHGSRILDLVLSSDDNLVNNLQVGPPIGNSDHSAICFSLNLSCARDLFAYRGYFVLIFRRWIGSGPLIVRLRLMISMSSLSLFCVILLSHSFPWLGSHYKGSIFLGISAPFISGNQLLGGGPPLVDCMRTGNRSIAATFDKKLRKYNRFIERKPYIVLNARLCERPGMGVLKAVDGSIVRTDCEKSELLADTFAKAFNPPSALNIPSCSASFPTMTDSTRFSADEIYQLLIKWPSSTSDTPDH
ncbi:hypothetical protein COOONC_17261, partial [Cooperia oncophora]